MISYFLTWNRYEILNNNQRIDILTLLGYKSVLFYIITVHLKVDCFIFKTNTVGKLWQSQCMHIFEC